MYPIDSIISFSFYGIAQIKIYFLFFTGERAGFKVLASLRHYRVMQLIDHAVNYNSDSALGMTQLPLKGNPISLGDSWRSGTPPVASDSCVAVLTLLYVAHSPLQRSVLGTGKRKVQSDQMSLKKVTFTWGGGKEGSG